MTKTAWIPIFILTSVLGQLSCSSTQRVQLPIASTPDPYTCAGFEYEDSSGEYDWSDYGKGMLAEIRRHWTIPVDAQGGAKGSVRLKFVISLDGTVACMDFLQRSGSDRMDVAAWNAVASSQPLSPFPADAPVTRGEVVNLTLYYNMRGQREDTVEFTGSAKTASGSFVYGIKGR